MPDAPGIPGMPLPPPVPPPRRRAREDSDRPSQTNMEDGVARERARGAEKLADMVLDALHDMRADFNARMVEVNASLAAMGAKQVALDADVTALKNKTAERHSLKLAKVGMWSTIGAAAIAGSFVLVQTLLNTSRTEAKSVVDTNNRTDADRIARIADQRIDEAQRKREKQAMRGDTILATPP